MRLGVDMNKLAVLSIAFCAIYISTAFSEMKALDDEEMSEAQGFGVGIVLEDFSFDSADGNLSVGGINQYASGRQNESIGINVTRLYLKGKDSQRGTQDTRYTVGSLNNPLELDVLSGSDLASISNDVEVLQVTWPEYRGVDTRTVIEEIKTLNTGLTNYLEPLLQAQSDLGQLQREYDAAPNTLISLQVERSELQDRRGDCGLLDFGCRNRIDDRLGVINDEIDEQNGIIANNPSRIANKATEVNNLDSSLAAGRSAREQAIEVERQKLSADVDGADVGISFNYTLKDYSLGNPNGVDRTDYHNYDLTGVDVYGTSLRLFTNERDGKSMLDGELDLRLYIKTLDLSSCNLASTACQDDEYRGNVTHYFTDLFFDLHLGYGNTQPLEFSVTEEGHINLRLAPVTAETAAEFYANSEKSYIYVGNLTHGGIRPPGSASLPTGTQALDLGSAELAGIRIQSLDVTTHDL